ncbi:DUF2070 family protein [Candidatus Micrarchaeota archaeon]|nr:DUF2070 family protein [Candidatus Micrarchaeota archaeon]
MDEIDDKAVSISRLAIRLPTYKRTFVYLFAVSFLAGFLLRLLIFPEARVLSSLSNSLLFGGAEGLLFIGLPALFASVLAASFTRKEDFSLRMKHFSFVALLATIVSSMLYFIGVAGYARFADLESFILLANSVVFLIWFAALFITLNFGWKTVLMASFHPALNLSFLVIWESFLLAGLTDPVLLFLKFVVSSGVLLLALASVFYVLNAPAKRNFGISTLQAATLFFAQLVYGKKDLENVLAEMGERVETLMGVVSFRTIKGKQKAVFIVPHLHYGPFGNIGGSEFPHLISFNVKEKLKCPVFVFHGLANHDYNPIYSFTSSRISSELVQTVKNFKASDYTSRAAFVSASYRTAKVLGVGFDKQQLFLAMSRAPETTEDISAPIGISFMEQLRGNGFREIVLTDMHNSAGEESKMGAGSPEYFEFYDLYKTISDPQNKKPFKLGVSHDSLTDFTTTEGIGKAGLNVAVFEVSGKRACFVLFDANNVLPSFRRELLLQLLSTFKFDYCDMLTTDTHSVNNFSMVHNPLGGRIDREKIANRVEQTTREAVKDLEFCQAAAVNRRTALDVWGAGRVSELLSTVSAIVAMAKIFAPLIFLASIVLALLLLSL